MACNGITSSSSFFPPNFFLQIQTPHEEHNTHPQLSSPLIISSTTPCNILQDHKGMIAPMVLGKRSMPFSENHTTIDHQELMNNNGEEELSDDGSQGGEKKRRLNSEQVRTLEKNFELANKLEPERKMQLAKDLGLQPRQVAIWFQNRRARWKTKQLERDYDVLKRQFDAIKAENDALHAQNKKFQAEILSLKGKETSELNLNKETEGSCSNNSEINESNLRSRTLPANNFIQPVRHADHIGRLLHSSARPENIQCIKLGNGDQGQFSMEDQVAFWNWPDQHNYH